jgi:CubicO group peptidase (beta-lactamase class C family)
VGVSDCCRGYGFVTCRDHTAASDFDTELIVSQPTVVVLTCPGRMRAVYASYLGATLRKLILQQGEREGQQILSSELLAECFVNIETNPAYGLTFWLHDEVGIEGAAPRPSFVLSDLTPDSYAAAGAGSQRLYIIPSLDLVIVRFSALGRRDMDASSTGRFSDEEFIDLLLGL